LGYRGYRNLPDEILEQNLKSKPRKFKISGNRPVTTWFQISNCTNMNQIQIGLIFFARETHLPGETGKTGYRAVTAVTGPVTKILVNTGELSREVLFKEKDNEVIHTVCKTY
jgi:hypothetical protein